MAPNPSSAHITLVRSFTQAHFDAFARLSGDDNPIHRDPTFTAEHTPFDRPVAHGMLLFTVLRGLLSRLAPHAQTLDAALTFLAPTYADDEMKFAVTLAGGSTPPACARFEVQRLEDGVITCEGSATLGGPAR